MANNESLDTLYSKERLAFLRAQFRREYRLRSRYPWAKPTVFYDNLPYTRVSPIVEPDYLVYEEGKQLLLFPHLSSSATLGYHPTNEKPEDKPVPIAPNVYIQRYIRWERTGTPEGYTSLVDLPAYKSRLVQSGKFETMKFLSSPRKLNIGNAPLDIYDIRMGFYPDRDKYVRMRYDERTFSLNVPNPKMPRSRWTWEDSVDDDAVVYHEHTKEVVYIGNPSVAAYIVQQWTWYRVTTKRQYLRLLVGQWNKVIFAPRVSGGRIACIGTLADCRAYQSMRGHSQWPIVSLWSVLLAAMRIASNDRIAS